MFEMSLQQHKIMEWIGWLYLSYFNVLYLAGLFWGLDEFLASRVVLTVVVSLHFVAGGIAGLQKGAEAVRERYSLAFGIGWINIFADALLLAALAVVWISEPLLYAAAGFATLGNSFCLAGHLRHKKLYQEGKYTADLAGGLKVSVVDAENNSTKIVAINNTDKSFQLHVHGQSAEHEDVFKAGGHNLLTTPSIPPRTTIDIIKEKINSAPAWSTLYVFAHNTTDGVKTSRVARFQYMGKEARP